MIPDRALVDAIKAALARELRRQADAVPLLPGWGGPYVDLEETDGTVMIDGHIDLEALAAAAAQPAADFWECVFAPGRELLGAIPRVATASRRVTLPAREPTEVTAPAPTRAKGSPLIELDRFLVRAIWQGAILHQTLWQVAAGDPKLVCALPGYRAPTALEIAAAVHLARHPWSAFP